MTMSMDSRQGVSVTSEDFLLGSEWGARLNKTVCDLAVYMNKYEHEHKLERNDSP